MKELIAKYKTIVILALTIVFCVVVAYAYVLTSGHKDEPVVYPVQDTSATQLRISDPKLSYGDARDISRRMDVVTRTQPPTVQYYTVTQAAADGKARELAKADGADKVIKQTKEVPVEGSNQKIIQNDYYAIQMQRKHDIKVGAAIIDSKAYASVSYRNRDVEYTAYYDPATQQGGAGVAVTVAKW